MKKRDLSEQEISQYARLFLLAHHQLEAMQRQLGPGLNLWQRWNFRNRHQRLRRELQALLQLKGGPGEDAEKSVEQDFKYMGTGKKGWAYVSVGEIEYLQGLLLGL